MIAKLCEVSVNFKKTAKNLSKITTLTPKDTRPTFCGLLGKLSVIASHFRKEMAWQSTKSNLNLDFMDCHALKGSLAMIANLRQI